jgi:hypothetical protein
MAYFKILSFCLEGLTETIKKKSATIANTLLAFEAHTFYARHTPYHCAIPHGAFAIVVVLDCLFLPFTVLIA